MLKNSLKNSKRKDILQLLCNCPAFWQGFFYFIQKTYICSIFLLKNKHMFFYNVTKEEGAAVRGLLLNALENQEPLEIIYLSDRGELSQRVIVLESVGDTHIRAFCKLRKQWRIFKLSNILSIRLAKERRKQKRVS
jgi:predicted DNA-binding transcriptional regulator YafY